jgi:hypothetical protein
LRTAASASHARALHGLVEDGARPAAIAVEEHAPALAGAGGVDADDRGVEGEDAHEADAEFADLGEVAVLARREQAHELLLDDGLVHALAVILHLEDAVGAVAEGADLDDVGAGVDRVLDELTQAGERIGELLDQRIEDVAVVAHARFPPKTVVPTRWTTPALPKATNQAHW